MPSYPFSASPRAAITVVFASFGAAIGALAGSMPAIMRNAGIDSETLGFGLALSTAMTVGAMALGGQIAKFASNRAVLLAVLPALGVLLTLYLTAQSPLWFYFAIIPMGAGFGLLDLFMNAEAAAIEHDMRRPVFTAFHGAVSCGVAIVAIIASFLPTLAGTWATGLLICVCFACAWIMVRKGIEPRQLATGTAGRMSSLPNRRPLMLLGLAAGLIIAAETAALLWSAKLLDELAPSLAAIAGLGAAFFGICNAAVRFPGDWLRSHFGDLPLMIASLVVSIAGFTALGMSQSFAASVAAFAGVGLGTAILIPCIFAMAAGFVPETGGRLELCLHADGRCRACGALGLRPCRGGLGIVLPSGWWPSALAVALALIIRLARRGETAMTDDLDAARKSSQSWYWWGIPDASSAAPWIEDPAACDIALVGVPHSSGNGSTERDQHLGPARRAQCLGLLPPRPRRPRLLALGRARASTTSATCRCPRR